MLAFIAMPCSSAQLFGEGEASSPRMKACIFTSPTCFSNESNSKGA